MNIRELVVKRILELCKENNLSINGLSTHAAVPPSTLKNIIIGESRNPGIVTIKKLCDGLNINIIEFFDTPEFRNLEQEIE